MNIRSVACSLLIALSITAPSWGAIIKDPLIDGHGALVVEPDKVVLTFSLSEDMVAMLKAVDVDIEQELTQFAQRMPYASLVALQDTQYGVFPKKPGDVYMEQEYRTLRPHTTIK